MSRHHVLEVGDLYSYPQVAYCGSRMDYRQDPFFYWRYSSKVLRPSYPFEVNKYCMPCLRSFYHKLFMASDPDFHTVHRLIKELQTALPEYK